MLVGAVILPIIQFSSLCSFYILLHFSNKIETREILSFSTTEQEIHNWLAERVRQAIRMKEEPWVWRLLMKLRQCCIHWYYLSCGMHIYYTLLKKFQALFFG
jgi:hypothetical protein